MKRRPLMLYLAVEMVAWIIAVSLSGQLITALNFTIFTVFVAFITGLLMFILHKIGVSGIFFWAPVFFAVTLLSFTHYYGDINEKQKNADKNIELLNCSGGYGRINKIEYKNEYTYIYIENLKMIDGREAGGILLMADDNIDYEPGMTVSYTGATTKFTKPTNPGQFDSVNYYKSKKILLRAINPQITILKLNTAIEHLIFGYKKKLLKSIELTGGESSGVYQAMLLGEKGELTEDTKGLYQAAGISHILAISGLHVSFIGMMVFFSLNIIFKNRPVSAAVTGIVILIYSYMIGNPVSALRAAIMLIISLGAKAAGRYYDMPTAFSVALSLVWLAFPDQLLTAGFQLSFGAIAAFAFVQAGLDELLNNIKKVRLRGRKSFLLRKLMTVEKSLLGSISVSIVTWPIIAWHMYVINPLSIFLNLIVIPFMSLLMTLIIVNSILGLFVYFGMISAGYNNILWKPCELILDIYRRLCQRTAHFQVVTGRPALWQLMLYIAFVIALVLFIRYINSRLERKRDYLELKDIKWNDYHMLLKRWGRIIIPAVMMACLMLGLLIIKRPSSNNTFIMLDVGQGDGMIYLDGELCIAVDGGSSFVSGIGDYRIAPAIKYYGYDKVDAWFITHPDKDHISGLYEILEDESQAVGVKRIYVSHKDLEEWDKLKELTDGKATLIDCGRGDEFSFRSGRLQILYPEKEETITETNKLSLVMKLDTKGMDMLLCGDIDTEVEEKLLAQYSGQRILTSDILKVAHHGSKYASTEELLKETAAKISLISVGKNNYGHPSPETVKRLRNANMNIFTTKDYGAIIIDMNSGKMWTS